MPGGKRSEIPRVCADTRGVNEVVEDFEHRVPDILALFLLLQGFLFASALDLTKSFHQFEVDPAVRHMLAFTWRGNKWQFRGAPFGVKTITAVFQSVMEAIFGAVVFVVLFVDDLLVFTRTTLKDHIAHVNEVLQLLNLYNLRLNVKKCRFGFRKLRVLGHILSGSQRSADPSKVRAVQDWPLPQTGKDIERLLGFLNYLRDYIPLESLATIAAPLESLRKLKKLGGLWTDACGVAFALFKKVLLENVVVCFPDYAYLFILAVDASQFGLGLVLYQLIGGKKHIVLFASKALNSAQRNYSATKRELLAIIFALQRCRNYLFGFKFELHTDHKALTFLFTQKHANYMMQSWMDVLLDFTFVIVHCPGVLNVLPDTLSRCYDEVLPVVSICLYQIVSEEGHSNVVRNLNLFVKQRLDKEAPTEDKRQQLLVSAHNQGHFGANYMFDKIWQLGYYWVELRRQCAELVATCTECLKYNVGKFGFHPARSLSAKEPFDACAIDTAGPYKTTPRGFNYFFVYVCLCTRYVIIVPTVTLMASEVAWHLWKIFCTFPVPKSLISDNGTQFVNAIIKALANLMGVSQSLIAPYNPSANGVAERFVGVVKTVLSKICGNNIANFDLYLPAVQLFMNSKISLLTKTSPMSYVFSRSPNAFADYSRTEMRLCTEPELLERCEQVRNVVFPALADAASSRAAANTIALDASRRVITTVYQNGSKVMVKDVTRSQKHSPYWTGPFVVLRRTVAGTYTLLSPDGSLYHRNVPLQHLKLIASRQLEDVSNLDARERTHLIEALVDHRGPEDKREYLVEWKGYADKTWEPYANFAGTGDLAIREYWQLRSSVVSEVPVTPVSVDVVVPETSVVEKRTPSTSVAPKLAAAPGAVTTRVGRSVKIPAKLR